MHPILGSARRRNLYLASWAVIGSLGAVAWSAANAGAGVAAALAVVVPPCLVPLPVEIVSVVVDSILESLRHAP